MNLAQLLRSLQKSYHNASAWSKILLFTLLLLVLLSCFQTGPARSSLEAFQQRDAFLLKQGADIYDPFYAEVYDYLVFNNLKDDFEVGWIMNSSSPSSESKILDVGCGTGHHVASLAAKGLDVIGIDQSPSMIQKAKSNFPDYKFQVADVMSGDLAANSFTHVLCMYFTIYYFPDKAAFFDQCYRLLLPGGYLIVHLVDRDRFDPILPPGNPLMYVSPQKYAKKRITSTKVKFTDFSYAADFQLNPETDTAQFVEKFKSDKDGKVRKNEHVLYMPPLQDIVDTAQACGFIVEGQADLLQCQYEYQYLYIFVKPS